MGVTSFANDRSFITLRWISLLAVTALLILAGVDVAQRAWASFAMSLLLSVLVIVTALRPAFLLGRSVITVDEEGIRRRGAWAVRWSQVQTASIEEYGGRPYMVVTERRSAGTTHITRFFLRKAPFPTDALVGPIDPDMREQLEDAIAAHREDRGSPRRSELIARIATYCDA